jgi:hypothetical protein
VLRTLKKTIQRDRNIPYLITLFISSIVIRMLSLYYENVVVASLPFQPVPYVKGVIAYTVDMTNREIVESNLQPVGAPFLFIMSFLSMMPIIRKLCFRRNRVQYKIKGLSDSSIGVPRKMIFQDSSNVVMDSTSKSSFWSMF